VSQNRKKKAKAARQATTRAAAPPAPPSTVRDVMSAAVHTCHADDTLAVAARIMWEQDCGFVPVTDGVGRLVGVVTDRDACMASYTQGKSLLAIPVSAAMATRVVTLHAADPLERAHELLRTHHLRRLPVVDGDHHVLGVVSLKDLAAQALVVDQTAGLREVAQTFGHVTKGRVPVEM
jgi:CBS domain-containing protein